MRILLVEDEPFIALDLQMVVEAYGHTVVGVAASEGEALLLAAAETPDAALVDVNLKDGLTGPVISQALARRGVRTAFVTGNSEHVPADRAGAVAVLDKPFTDAGIARILGLLAEATD